MRVLVTGGAGFLGRAVVRALVEEGFQVRVFDLVPAGDTAPGESYVGSILDPNAICRAMEGMDAVVHLAAMLGVARTEKKRLGCLEVNIQGTVNVLEAAVKERVCAILFASSSEVYGDALEIPIRETTPVQPRSIYAISKLAGEEYVRSYAERYGLAWSIARLFNCYGTGQVAEFVLPRFVRACRESAGPVIYGDGSQVRCFCHVDDTSRGIAGVLARLERERQAPAPAARRVSGEGFNLGNPNSPVSMKELAELTVRIASRRMPERDFSIRPVPFSKSDRTAAREIARRVPDITKAVQRIGFAPQVGLAEGIDRLFEADIPGTWFEPLASRSAATEPVRGLSDQLPVTSDQ